MGGGLDSPGRCIMRLESEQVSQRMGPKRLLRVGKVCMCVSFCVCVCVMCVYSVWWRRGGEIQRQGKGKKCSLLSPMGFNHLPQGRSAYVTGERKVCRNQTQPPLGYAGPHP